MKMAEIDPSNNFVSVMKEVFLNKQKSVLSSMQDLAWDQYKELSWPCSNSDAFKGFPLNKLSKERFEGLVEKEEGNDYQEVLDRAFFKESLGQRLVFVDGFFRSDLSSLDKLPEELHISSIEDAYLTFGQALTGHWKKMIKKESDPFFLLNQALFQEGAFVYIPPSVQVKEPIEILHIVTDKAKRATLFPKLVVMLGKSSEVSIIAKEYYTSSETASFCSQSFEFILSENASLDCTHFTINTCQASWHLSSFRSSLKRDARLKVVSLTNGSKSIREDYYVNLEGENANAWLYGGWILNGIKQSHTSVLIEHHEPNCTSSQLFRGTLNGHSQSNFFGKIYVHPKAQQTQAYQLNNNLILDDKSRAQSKPHLEIFADDVKASHGSTVGKLCEQQLFYLKTRGIDEQEARKILIKGFTLDLIAKISCKSAKQYAERIAEESLVG